MIDHVHEMVNNKPLIESTKTIGKVKRYENLISSLWWSQNLLRIMNDATDIIVGPEQLAIKEGKELHLIR